MQRGQHDNDMGRRSGLEELLYRTLQDGYAPKVQKLLGNVPTHTGAAAAGNKYRINLHRKNLG